MHTVLLYVFLLLFTHVHLYKPITDHGPQNVVKLVGSTAVLECLRNASGEVDWTYVNDTNGNNNHWVPISEVTNHYRKETSGYGVHRLYIENLSLADSGKYVCRSVSSQFDPKAAYIVTVAHPPHCSVHGENSQQPKLVCWISYNGRLNIRMRWIESTGQVERIIEEKNFTSLTTGNSVFSIEKRLPAEYLRRGKYTCDTTFLSADESSDVASNSPEFPEGVCMIPEFKEDTMPAAATTDSAEWKIRVGIAVGITVGIIVIILLVVLLILYKFRKNKRLCVSKNKREHNMEEPVSEHEPMMEDPMPMAKSMEPVPGVPMDERDMCMCIDPQAAGCSSESADEMTDDSGFETKGPKGLKNNRRIEMARLDSHISQVSESGETESGEEHRPLTSEYSSSTVNSPSSTVYDFSSTQASSIDLHQRHPLQEETFEETVLSDEEQAQSSVVAGNETLANNDVTGSASETVEDMIG